MAEQSPMATPRCADDCACGTYHHTVALPLAGRVRHIDTCIHKLVAALEAGGCEPAASCCGHGSQVGSVLLRDGRELLIFPNQEASSRAQLQSMTDERLGHIGGDEAEAERERRARGRK
jgi:hypothetical protein